MVPEMILVLAVRPLTGLINFCVYGLSANIGERNASQGYLTPIYPQSGYGMMLEIKFNDYIELHGGMERSYNPMKRKWETAPVVYPVIKLKR